MRKLSAAAQLRQARAEVECLKTEVQTFRRRQCEALDRVGVVEEESYVRLREMQAMLGRARDLLIHEKIAAQKDGRDAGYIKLPSGGTTPVGWRLNGVTDLIATIDLALRGS